MNENDIETCIERLEFDGIPDSLMSLPRGSMGWQRVREKLEVEDYDFSNPIWDLDRVLYFMEDEGDLYFAKNPYNNTADAPTSPAPEVVPELPVTTVVIADTTEYDRWFSTSEPSPKDYDIVEYNEKTGRPFVNPNNIIRYLEDSHVIFDGYTAYKYDGQIYRTISELKLKEIIHNACDSYINAPFLTDNSVKDVIKKMQATVQADRIKTPHGFATGELPGGKSSISLEDYSGNCVPVRNGVLNLDTNTLLPFTPFIFFKRQIDTVFDPSVNDCPELERIYAGILPDPKTRAFFWEMVGFIVFSPTLSPPSLFVTYGPGETGKSALKNAVTRMIGEENVSPLDITQMSAKFSNTELEGKILNVCGEAGSGKSRESLNVDGELIKRLSEGDTVSVEKKHGPSYTIRNTAKLWFIANSPPNFGDATSGIYRRLYIFPCKVQQNWADQIYDKMQTEEAKTWLLNKALEGYRRFLANDRKFTVSDEMDMEKNIYQSLNPLMDWVMSEFGTTDKDVVRKALHKVFVFQIYPAYREYVLSIGGKNPLMENRFADKMRTEFALNIDYGKTLNPDTGRDTRRRMFLDPIQMQIKRSR